MVDTGYSNSNIQTLALPQANVPFVDNKGIVTREWWRFLQNLYNRVGAASAFSNTQLAQLASAQRPVYFTDDSTEDVIFLPPTATTTQMSITQNFVISDFVMDDNYQDVESICISFRKP